MPSVSRPLLTPVPVPRLDAQRLRSFWPCLAVMLAGLVLAAGSAVALVTTSTSRGAPVTTKAPPKPKLERGFQRVGQVP